MVGSKGNLNVQHNISLHHNQIKFALRLSQHIDQISVNNCHRYNQGSCFILNEMSAQVLEVDNEGAEVLVHFAGWNGRHDEWIKMDSPRLQPYTRRSSRRRQSTGDNSGSEGGSDSESLTQNGRIMLSGMPVQFASQDENVSLQVPCLQEVVLFRPPHSTTLGTRYIYNILEYFFNNSTTSSNIYTISFNITTISSWVGDSSNISTVSSSVLTLTHPSR